MDRKRTRRNNSLYYSQIIQLFVYILISITIIVLLGLPVEENLRSSSISAFALQLRLNDPQYPDLRVLNSGSQPGTDIFNIGDGYRIEPIIWNLTLPSSITFDKENNMYIAESGYIYGGLTPQPRILKLSSNGSLSVFVDRGLNGPITDLKFHDDSLYVSHKGIISTINKNGKMNDIITGLPSQGDHQNNQLAFGPDGKLYFGQGTSTNSGIIGLDNFIATKIDPQIHDLPPEDISLAGQNFITPNPFTRSDPTDLSVTGAFVPFGQNTTEGEIIKGNAKCSGCIISSNSDGSDLQVLAWGLRNPYGLAFANNTNLIISDNGADNRGSRPIINDQDKVYTIKVANKSNEIEFFGWPDFFGGKVSRPVTDPIFKSIKSKQPLHFLLQSHPHIVNPLASLGQSVAPTEITLSNSSQFGFKGKLFIGEFGEIGGSPLSGQKIVLLNPQNGNTSNFVSLKTRDTSFRPVGISFNNDENALYVVSIGKAEQRISLPNNTHLREGIFWAYPHTGVIWKITKVGRINLDLTSIGGRRIMLAANKTENNSNP